MKAANHANMSNLIVAPKNEIVVYQPDETMRHEVRLAQESVWLTQSQMAQLFGCSVDNIGLHLRNIYQSGELRREATAEESSVVRKEGTRAVTRRLTCYNLDAIISVGYRVNSIRGVKFRQWATSVLREYLLRGYAVNTRLNQLDVANHNRQYRPIKLIAYTGAHDRFLIADSTVYHIGASLKDLGTALFAFSKMEIPVSEILSRLHPHQN